MEYPNWFASTDAIRNFEKHLAPLADKPDLSVLQIGAYTGDATELIVNNIFTPKYMDKNILRLIDVDTWEGSDEPVHHNMDWQDVWQTYLTKNNWALDKNLVVPMKMTSDKYFSIMEHREFDFIYVDGDHTAFQVLKDGINAWSVLKPGGILAFDDYTWDLGKGIFYNPRYAIDAIIELLGDMAEVLEINGQAWLKKK